MEELNQNQEFTQNQGASLEQFKGKSTRSLVCGIISVAIAWFGYAAIAGLVLGVIAIILAVGVNKECQQLGLKPTGMNTGGLVLGIIGTVLSGIVLVSCVICAGLIASAVPPSLW